MKRLDKVLQVLAKKVQSAKPSDVPCTFAIYMDYEFYSLCQMELVNSAGNHPSHLDFLNNDMLLGHPIYRVVSVHGREGAIAHPNFVIHQIS